MQETIDGRPRVGILAVVLLLTLAPGASAQEHDGADPVPATGSRSGPAPGLTHADDPSDAARADAARRALERGKALAAQGRPEEALAALERAAALDPPYPLALNEIGVGLVRLGRLVEAVSVLERAVGHDPGFAAAWGNLGEAQRRREAHAEAVGAYGRALDLDRAQPAVWYGLAASLNALGDKSEALGALERYQATALPTEPRRAEVEAAVAALRSGGTSAAPPRWTPAPLPIVESTTTSPADPARAAEPSTLGEPPETLVEAPASETAEVIETVEMPTAPADSTERDGDEAFARRRYLAALAAYQQAAARSPHDPGIAYKIGATLAVMGDPRGALRAWRVAVHLEPTRPFLFRHAAFAGRWRAEREGTPLGPPERDAEAVLQAARAALLADQPALALVLLEGREDREAVLLAGEAALAGGLAQRALDTFSARLEAAPDDAAALGGAAEALLRLGRDDEAEERISRWAEGSALEPSAFVIIRAGDLRARMMDEAVIEAGPSAE